MIYSAIPELVAGGRLLISWRKPVAGSSPACRAREFSRQNLEFTSNFKHRKLAQSVRARSPYLLGSEFKSRTSYQFRLRVRLEVKVKRPITSRSQSTRWVQFPHPLNFRSVSIVWSWLRMDVLNFISGCGIAAFLHDSFGNYRYQGSTSHPDHFERPATAIHLW